MRKRGIIIGDTHCGHLAGLTPPEYQDKEYKNSTTKRNKWAKLQKELWTKYKELLKKYEPYNFGLYMGDGIEGTGYRSGGSELIRPDIDDQIDMAVYACNEVRLHATKGFEWVGVYGTPYHTGTNMDHENTIAKDAGFKKIGSHEWIDVNGCIIDIKHFVSSSVIPHGRHTALSRAQLWNALWADQKLVPRANVILRGHVHYNSGCYQPGWEAMSCPALQGMGSKYGSRLCEGIVHWGITYIDIDDDGSWSLYPKVTTIEAQKAKAINL